eukprot:5281208-Amphidinium_carterae.1
MESHGAPAGGAAAAAWMPGAAQRGPSLLDQGRAPPPGMAAAGVPAEGAGTIAYQRTLAAARQLIAADGQQVSGPAETHGLRRQRMGEDTLRSQVMAGGVEGLQATQLAILEALERLQSPTRGARDPRHDTLEDILWGLGSQQEGAQSGLVENNEESRGCSSKGLGGLSRLQTAMSQHPERVSALADQRAWKLLGADITHTPWSMQQYAQQHLKFGKLESQLGDSPKNVGHALQLSCLGATEGLAAARHEDHTMFESGRTVGSAWRKLAHRMVAHRPLRLKGERVRKHWLGTSIRACLGRA